MKGIFPFVFLQPRNYQLRNNIVHEITFGDINNLLYSDRYFNTNWQFEMLKRGKANGHNTCLVYIFKIGFLYFSNICGWYTLELHH